VAPEGGTEEVSPDEVVVVDDEHTLAGKRHAVDTPEGVVGKRVRLPSQYVVSPYTAEAKRRTFIDGTYPNLFREVDAAKWKAFETEWRIMKPG
jgi:hypothetical protein